MTHYLTLVDWAFTLIKNKEKTIEMRLNDEKRQNIKRFDEIEFTNLKTNEKIYVWVKQLHPFKSFDELYAHFDKKALGYHEDEIALPSDMEQFYSKENIEKYGVLGIEVELLEKGKSEVERIDNTIKIIEEVIGEKIK